MGHSVSVFTSHGPDPGLSPDERRERARRSALERSRASARARLERINAKMAGSSGPSKAKLQEKAIICLNEINRVSEELSSSLLEN